MGKKGKSIKRLFPTKKELGFFGKPVHSKTKKHLK